MTPTHSEDFLTRSRRLALDIVPASLAIAKQRRKLKQLLTTFSFIEEKVSTFGPQAMIDDCHRLADDPETAAIGRALEVESHILTEHPDLLWQQLFNRLKGHSERLNHILNDELTRQRSDNPDNLWFNAAGRHGTPDGLVRTLAGHTGAVETCMFVSSVGWLISTDSDGEVKAWSPATGKECASLGRHAGSIIACRVGPNETLVSVSESDTQKRATGAMQVWDLKAGTQVASIIAEKNEFGECALSGDASRLAATSSEQSIAIWDMLSGRQQASVTFADSWLAKVLISSDGDFILCQDGEGLITVADTSNGETRFSWQGPSPTHPAFLYLSPDGQTLVTSGSDGSLQLWDITGKERLSLLGHSDTVTCCAIDVDRQLLASGSADRTVCLRSLVTGELQGTLYGHSGRIKGCMFSPKADFLVSYGEDGKVIIWEVETGAVRAAIRPHPPNEDKEESFGFTQYSSGRMTRQQSAGSPLDTIKYCSISPDNASVVTVGNGREAKTWDAVDGALQRVFSARTKIETCCVGEGIVILGDADGRLEVWNTRSGELQTTFWHHTGGILACKVANNSDTVASVSKDGTCRVWNTADGAERLKVFTNVRSNVEAMFDKDMRVLVTRVTRHKIKVWDVASREVTMTLPGHVGYISEMSMDDAGQRLLTFGADNILQIWELDGPGDGATLPISSHADHRELSPDGSVVVAFEHGGALSIWHNAQLVVRDDAFSDSLSHLVISPDSTRIVVVEQGSKALHVFDAKSGERLGELNGDSDSVTCCQFASPRVLIAGYGDGSIVVWDVETMDQRQAYRGHTGRINAIAELSELSLIASVGNDRTIKLWDTKVSSREEVNAKHTSRVSDCEYTKDGRLCVTGGHDGRILLWEVETGKQVGRLDVPPDFTVDHLLVSRDGYVIACCNSAAIGEDISDVGMLNIWICETGKSICTRVAHVGRINDICISPDGHRVVTSGSDKVLRIWSIANGKKLRELRGQSGNVVSCAFSPDGRFVFSASDDQTFSVWSSRNGRKLQTLSGRSFVCDNSGHFVFVGCDNVSFYSWNVYASRYAGPMLGRAGAKVSVNLQLSPSTSIIVRGLDPHSPLSPFAKRPIDCALTPGGRIAVVTSRKNAVSVVDTETGRVNALISGCYLLATSRDGRYVAVGSELGISRGGAPEIIVMDIARFRIARLPLDAKPSCAAFSARDSRLVCGDVAGSVRHFTVEGLDYGVPGITVVVSKGTQFVRCFYCGCKTKIDPVPAGGFICRLCGQEMRLEDWHVRDGVLPSFQVAPPATEWLSTHVVALDEIKGQPGGHQCGERKQCQANEECNAELLSLRRPTLWLGEPPNTLGADCVVCNKSICGDCAEKVLRRVRVGNLVMMCWQLVCPNCLVGLGNEHQGLFSIYADEDHVIAHVQNRSADSKVEKHLQSAFRVRLQEACKTNQEKSLATVCRCFRYRDTDKMFQNIWRAISQFPADSLPWLYATLLSAHHRRSNEFQRAFVDLARFGDMWTGEVAVSCFPGEKSLIEEVLTLSSESLLGQQKLRDMLKFLSETEESLARALADEDGTELSTLHSQVMAYRGGTSSSTLAKYLFDEPPPIIQEFLDTVECEENLDFEQLKRERSELIHKLIQNVSQTETEELVNRAAEFRSGRSDHSHFYSYLYDLANQHGTDLSACPLIQRYVDYVNADAELDLPQVAEFTWNEMMARYKDNIPQGEKRDVLAAYNRVFLARLLIDYLLRAQQSSDTSAEDELKTGSYINRAEEQLEHVAGQIATRLRGIRDLVRSSLKSLRSDQTSREPKDSAITYFPGMPMLTFFVRTRISHYLPDSQLRLVPTSRAKRLNEDRVEAYSVFVDNEDVGRFTIRETQGNIERNFLCLLPARSAIPRYVLQQSSRGTGGSRLDDVLRIAYESMLVFLTRCGLGRLFGLSAKASEMLGSNGKMSLLAVSTSIGSGARPRVTQHRCDLDGVLFSAPPNYLNVVDSKNPEQKFLIDVGGYCAKCQKLLCAKHVQFTLDESSQDDEPPHDKYGFRRWVLTCKECESPISPIVET